MNTTTEYTMSEKTFSLNQASRETGIAKSTLHAAIERDELQAGRNAQGHHVINGAQLMQFQLNNPNLSKRTVPTEVSVIAEPSSPERSDSGFVDPDIYMVRKDHEQVIRTLNGTIERQDSQIEKLESQVDVVKLLTDQSRGGEVQNKAWKSKLWQWLYYLFVLLGFVFLGLFLWGNWPVIERAVSTLFEQL